MSERYIRVGDGHNWYTKHKDEKVVIKQLAERLKMVGDSMASDIKVYWLGPKEQVPPEMRTRIVQAALELI